MGMFGRRRSQREADQELQSTGRYRVVRIADDRLRPTKPGDLFVSLEHELNAGDARGWKLVRVQAISGMAAMIVWDTQPHQLE